MKHQHLLLAFFILLIASCTHHKNKQVNLDKTPISEVKFTSTIKLSVGDGVKDFGLYNGLLYVQRSLRSPIFVFFNMNGEQVDSFGILGHGENELIMPTLLAENNTSQKSIHIYDNGTKTMYDVHGQRISAKNKFAFPFVVNEMKSAGWPCVGYSYFKRDSVKLEIYNAEKQQICGVFNIADHRNNPDVFMLSVSWDAYADHIVYAYMYYNKFSVSTWDATKQKISDTFECDLGKTIPKKEKCYYTDVACGEKSFFLLSQKNVKCSAEGGGGYSEIEEFDYNGNALRRIRLDGLFMKMAYNHQSTLFLLSLNEAEVKCLDIR